MVMTRSYRLVAYLPAPLIQKRLWTFCAGLAPGCFRGGVLPHRTPNSTVLRIVTGHRRCSRSSFMRVRGGGEVMPYSPDHKKGTRQRILNAAAHLFNKKGFSEASIEEIMTAAGLTHGGFYRHFHSKDELYAEAVRNF